MRYCHLTLGLAVATVHAVPFSWNDFLPSEAGPRSMEFHTRDNAPDPPIQQYICPKSTDSQPDAITKKPINTTELAFAQQQLLSWCDANNDLDPSTGGQGHVETYHNATVQLCNQDSAPRKCNSTAMKFVMDGIQCGVQSSPIEGYGQVKDNKKAKNPETWYVFYSGRAGNVSNCMDAKDLSKLPAEKHKQ